LITAQSIAWIESYATFKRLGTGVGFSTAARDVDAFLVLEDLVARERTELALDSKRQSDGTVTRDKPC
jgi:hypothetical protein